MTVTQDDVIHCAQLAHISLHKDELEPLRQAMASVLNHAQNINQLNLEDVEPYIHRAYIMLPRRSDEARPTLSQTEALANAPQTSDGYFLVPKIM